MGINIEKAIKTINDRMNKANHSFINSFYNKRQIDPALDYDEDKDIAEYYAESAFAAVLILLEHLNLTETYKNVSILFELAKKNGFTESAMGFDEPYIVSIEKLRIIVDGISSLYGLDDSVTSEMHDIKTIIKQALYVICDIALFKNQPKNEADVHDRIESILKCYFSDLKRKPSLTKPIKNFEPDSGIPSTQTLIEYKFVNSKKDAKLVVDQILADTNGYKSSKWKNLLFVIYETHRVLPEKDWKALLHECELRDNYDIVVLPGDAS